jgi:hypothetical protein
VFKTSVGTLSGFQLFIVVWIASYPSLKTDNGLTMPVVLEINFVLWIMIGCAVLEAAQYLD